MRKQISSLTLCIIMFFSMSVFTNKEQTTVETFKQFEIERKGNVMGLEFVPTDGIFVNN